MAGIRTFIAFEAPQVVRERAAAIIEELKKAGTDTAWQSADAFHVTIKFLGNVDEALLPGVIADIETILRAHRSFDVCYAGIGGFPNLRRPRILWMGCENQDGRLLLLKNALDLGLAPRGFAIEPRGFHPHITLGRIRTNRRLAHLTPMLEKLTLEPHMATVNGINVMRSVLKPQGALYTVLRGVGL